MIPRRPLTCTHRTTNRGLSSRSAKSEARALSNDVPAFQDIQEGVRWDLEGRIPTLLGSAPGFAGRRVSPPRARFFPDRGDVRGSRRRRGPCRTRSARHPMGRTPWCTWGAPPGISLGTRIDPSQSGDLDLAFTTAGLDFRVSKQPRHSLIPLAPGDPRSPELTRDGIRLPGGDAAPPFAVVRHDTGAMSWARWGRLASPPEPGAFEPLRRALDQGLASGGDGRSAPWGDARSGCWCGSIAITCFGLPARGCLRPVGRSVPAPRGHPGGGAGRWDPPLRASLQ
jgi:hypothetical protein